MWVRAICGWPMLLLSTLGVICGASGVTPATALGFHGYMLEPVVRSQEGGLGFWARAPGHSVRLLVTASGR